MCKIPLAPSVPGVGLGLRQVRDPVGTDGRSSTCMGFEPQTKDLLKAVEGLKAHTIHWHEYVIKCVYFVVVN